MEIAETIITATIGGAIAAAFTVIAHRITNRRRPGTDDQGDDQGGS